MRRVIATLLALPVLAAGVAVAQTKRPAAANPALTAAVAAPTRTPANVARDRYRHPAETLAFFGVKPGDVVVEAIPGGGWYSEILAPYLAKSGTYYAAQPAGRGREALAAKFAANPIYARAKLADMPLTDATVPAGSVDVIVTFRNVHNLIMAGGESADRAFASFHRALKPGGTLGIVDHRLPEARPTALEKTSGYLKRSTVVALATKAGFRLVAESEVNANPRDTADHPAGVWTLPPVLRQGDVDRAKYVAIGESDRMTLKFIKPR